MNPIGRLWPIFWAFFLVHAQPKFDIPPGIAVAVNQKALDYLTEQAQQFIPAVLYSYKLPDKFEGSGYTVSNLKMTNVSSTHIVASFEEDGIMIRTYLPTIIIQGTCKAGIDWLFSTVANFWAQFDNTVVETLVVFTHLDNGVPASDVGRCNSRLGTSKLKFLGEGVGTDLLNMVSPFIEAYVDYTVNHYVNETICETLQKSVNDGSACDKDIENIKSCQSIQNDYTFDLTAQSLPKMTNQTAYAPVDGRVRYKGQEAPSLVGNWTYNHSDIAHTSMLNIFISDRSLNQFFYFAKQNRLGQIDETTMQSNLPRGLRRAISTMCGGCNVKIATGLSEAPTMRIDAVDGPKLRIKGWVQAKFKFLFRTVTLFHVRADVIASVNPYIKGNYLVAQAHMEKVDIVFVNRGMSRLVGMFTEELLEAIEEFVPQKLEPLVNRELKFVFRPDCGVPLLPSFCGVTLENAQLRYVQNAIVIDSEISYDMGKLFKPFTNSSQVK